MLTRRQYAFSRNFKEHGQIRLSTYLKTFRYGPPRTNIEMKDKNWDSDENF